MSDPVITRTSGWIHRVALGAIILIGAFLVAFPLATSLPSKSSDTGNMMTAFRPLMTDTSLAQGKADQQAMTAMAVQLNTQMLPDLAQQLHMTPAQLGAFMATQYPAVAKGMAQFPTMLPYFADLQTTMATQQSNYQQADQIPTSFLPPTSMTWLFVVPGLILVGFGVYGLLRPRRVGPMVVASGVMGAMLAVGLLATTMYSKASAADEMNTAFQPVFATQSVQQARAYTDTVVAMSTEFTQKALPGFAGALNVTPQQMSSLMAARYPAVAAGAAQLPAIVQRMETATTTLEQNVGNYGSATSIPWSPGSMVTFFWYFMVPALLVVAVAGGWIALAVGRGSFAQPAWTGPRTRAAHS